MLALVRAQLGADEDDATKTLLRGLRKARRRGYLTRRELEAVCRWKSPRAIRLVRGNTPQAVRAATRRSLRTRDEEGRVRALLVLKGVSVPMASSVLTLLDPGRYGAIDIRVWQLLEQSRQVTGNRGGVGLGVSNWLRFLAVLRELAASLGVTARDAERALFDLHRRRQRGTLYRS